MTSDKCADESRVYSVNRMAVASATATGLSCSGLTNILELNLHVKTFNAHVKAINERNNMYSTALLDKAVTHVKTLYADLPTPGGRNQGFSPSKPGILDINQGDLS